MLSEVWQLVNALDAVGQAVDKTHPRVKAPGKTTGPCLRVRIKDDGAVGAVEGLADDEWPGLWTVMEGNQNSFPVMRLTRPLLRLPRSHGAWKQLGFDEQGRRKKTAMPPESLALLEDLWRQIEKSESTNVWQTMSKKAKELEACSAGHDPQSREVLAEFGRRFVLAAQNPPEFVRQIGAVSLNAWRNGQIQGKVRDAVEALLVGMNPPQNDNVDAKTKVQLAFDLNNEHELPVRLYSTKVRQHLVGVLPQKAPSEQLSSSAADCSFCGQKLARQNRPFPKVRLPVLNKDFPLFSMFSEAPCNTRYGLTDSMAIPVAESTVSRMADALTYITRKDREGYNWRAVASGKFERKNGRTLEKSDLLMVYPETKPDIAERVADIFGNDEQTIERQFDADTKTVCEALDTIAKNAPASRLRLLVIRKVSEGQAQIAIAESPTVAEVIAAANRWSQAVANNLPEIVIPFLPPNKGEAVIQAHPLTPYPDEVVRMLSEQWMNEGRRSSKAPGVGLGDVLHVMLRTPGKWEATRDRMLDLLVMRLSPLLMGIGNALHQGTRDSWDGYSPVSRRMALRAIAVSGILLHAHNRHREIYMTSPAFDIGQMLKLADILHKDYCTVVRKGSLPPSLIGNAMMPRAMDNPKLAVADLADRMRVYSGWAKTARDPKATKENDPLLIAVREARKTLRRFEPVAGRLREGGLPERCDNAMKAEMLLGYLAKVQDAETNEKESIHE